MSVMSKKGEEFAKFSVEVLKHIESYSIKQYGDYPDEFLENTSVKDMIHNTQRYLHRTGTNARGAEESLRDMLKVAHYACLIYNRLKAADPFYSEENQERLAKAIDDLNHGRNCAVHELIEEKENGLP